MLVPATRPVPEPKTGEVLIRIAAAGVNRADCLQRMGRYPMPSGASDIPGLECSGTVVKTGEEVSQWQIGDRLCALMVADGYSEYAAVPAVQCLPAPENVSLVDAAGLPETFSFNAAIIAAFSSMLRERKVEPVTVRCLRCTSPKSASTLAPCIRATKQSRPSRASNSSCGGM